MDITESRKIRISSNGANTALTYTLDSDETISAFLNGMLTNNVISGVTGYGINCLQGETTLEFTVNNCRTLAEYSRGGLPKMAFLRIFRNIAEALLNAEKYMLDESCFLLCANYVFIDNSDLSASLIPLPTNKHGRATVCTLFKECESNGIFDLSADGSYLSVIKGYINSSNGVSVNDFLKFIDSVAAGGVSRAQPAAARPERVAQLAPAAPAAPPQTAKPPQAPTPSVDANTAKSGKRGFIGGFFGGKSGAKPEKAGRQNQKQQNPISDFGDIALPGNPGMSVQTAPARKEQPVQPVRPAQPVQPVQPAQPRQTAVPAVTGSGDETIIMGAGASVQTSAYLTDKTGARFEINTNVFWIGRSVQSNIKNNIVLSNVGVGRNHAYIETVGGEYYLVDNNSGNGTYLNGERIAANTRTKLSEGAKIAFWNEEFIFHCTK